MSTLKKSLTIEQGKTFSLVLRWETEPIVYVPITAIAQSAPVRITAPAHGLSQGWRAAAVGGRGMNELMARPNEVTDRDYHPATVLSTDEIEFNDVNAAGFRAYVSGGHLQYNTPVDLTGYEGRMSIKDKPGGTELMALTTDNGRLLIDAAQKTITILISAVDTAAVTWLRGMHELEMESPTGVVTKLMEGAVSVVRELPT